jgi:hypothetical protein
MSVWNQSDGNITFDIAHMMQLEGQNDVSVVVFSFVVVNPRLPQAPPVLTATASLFYVEGVSWNPAVLTSTCPTVNNVHLQPFKVEALSFSSVQIASFSSDPCTSSTIDVKIAPGIPLACALCITLSGFTGSRTADRSSFTLTSQGSKLHPTASWTQAGAVSVCLTSGAVVPKDDVLAFSFEIKNNITAQDALTVIDIDISMEGGVAFDTVRDSSQSFMSVSAPSWKSDSPPIFSANSTQPVSLFLGCA